MLKIRCPMCGKTLFFADDAKLEIKCPRKTCKAVLKIEIKDQSVKHMDIVQE